MSGIQPDGTEWTLRAVFEEMRQDELDNLVAAADGAADEELVRHALVGWGEVLDGGEQVPYADLPKAPDSKNHHLT